jgi:hypothetical protein
MPTMDPKTQGKAGSARDASGSNGARLTGMLELGPVLSCGPVMVIPLSASTEGGPWYVTLGEAVATGNCRVAEVDEGGSVPNLRVDNNGDTLVLVLDGEELRGAKQNRVLNTTILVGKQSSLVVPVSCTEQGRWSYESREFFAAEYIAERKLRASLQFTVDASVRSGRGHRSDQGRVWDEVRALHADQATSSPTGAMRGAFEDRGRELQEYVDALPAVEGQQGLLVLLGGAVVGMDFVSIPEKYARVHTKLVRSYALAALGAERAGAVAPAADDALERARAFLARIGGLSGERFKSPGLGWDTRFAGSGIVGSLLTYRDRPIHAAFFAVDGGEQRGRESGADGRIAGARVRARAHGSWGGARRPQDTGPDLARGEESR